MTPQSNSQIISIKDLSFSYTEDPVIVQLDYILKKGETSAIVGGNGSGKSTFVKLILGELKPQAGTIKVFGQDISQIKDFSDFGYVPQVNVVDTVSFPVTCEEMLSISNYRKMGVIKLPRRKDLQRSREALAKFNLEEYAGVPFNELSGGLQQRVMIALSMMNSPRLLILDEPTAGVDQQSKIDFLHLLEDLKQKNELTILIVTHEIEFVQETLSVDSIYKIEKGALIHV